MENLTLNNRTGVTAPKGFTAAGIAAGIKKNGDSDIAIVYSEAPAAAAGIFTLNKVRGHSLELSVNNLKNGKARAVFINSGNANACLGAAGYEDAVEITKICAENLGLMPSEVLTGSTGVIGYPLPMDKISNGIGTACLSLSHEGGHNAAKAIMTTDTHIKEASAEFESEGMTVTIGGMAKGSGMIEPNMATMIGVITTDAFISSKLLKTILKRTADKSFNRISIDGDTSVCDKVIILANGMSGIPEILPGTAEELAFEAALLEVSVRLAKMIAADGEGATKLIEIKIKNAASAEDAHLAAKSISNSPLVKTAFYGEDANWGRILTAIGYSGYDFDPSKANVSVGHLLYFENGIVIPFNEDEAKSVLRQKDITVTVDFKDGFYDTTVWTCDLTHDYIDINASYRT